MIICAKYLMTGDGKTVLEDKAGSDKGRQD